jgi:SulP family sulfate permease
MSPPDLPLVVGTPPALTAPPRASFAELFTPKLVTVLRERYGLADLKADAIAGLTVAIVALPLSMAIAIASGVTPDRGLYTSIIGGFIVAALGGSRFQIAGPAGAFIVLVSATVAQHGLDGLLLATMMSGLMLLLVGFLRLGTFIKYIPYPVTVGFTSGIAVIIFASQLKELLGLALDREPGPIVSKLLAIGQALPTANHTVVGLAALTIAVIVAIRRFRPHWPAFIIAVAIAAGASVLLDLRVDTIGTRFGGIPHALPMPELPALSWSKVIDVFPSALSFALLGCIESLLSAVVADSMSGRRHRSNCELVAQGAANVVAPLFGGFCVTGNIARTATNVRSGARSPISGMLHSVFLLLFMLVAAPLASYIPLAALAGVLAVVAWNMVEKHEFVTLLRASWGDALVLLATFLLVVFRDLTEGILVGFMIGVLLFLHRMAQTVEVENFLPAPDQADTQGGRTTYDPGLASDRDIVICRISGAFFFGAAAGVSAALDRTGEQPKGYVLDISSVPFLDSTGAATIEGFVRKANRRGARVVVAGASPAVRRSLLVHGVRPPRVRYRRGLADAIATARNGAGGVSP